MKKTASICPAAGTEDGHHAYAVPEAESGHYGQVIEAGTHEELLAAGGKYAQIWEVQAGLYLES